MPPHKRGAVRRVVDYPTGDGKPIAETPTHRDNLGYLIDMLRVWYTENPDVYISGNMLLYYEEGNKHKRVSPDVFVTHGVPKDSELRYYATWRESKGPDFVVEITSRSTRREDTETKFRLYQNILRVPEYFLFDPYAEYLKPPLQGYRLKRGRYVRVKPVRGRLPSEVIGLHLERSRESLRLFDPSAREWVPTHTEKARQLQAYLHHAVEEKQQAVEEKQRAVEEKQQAVEEKQQAVMALLREARARLGVEAGIASLRKDLEALRRASGQA
jgi:Uma2 family endonuclease